MRITPPYPDVPGDRDDKIMARNGQLIGFNKAHAVWVFGFVAGSDAAIAYNCHTRNNDLMFVLASIKTGNITDVFYGWAHDMPPRFRKVVDAPAGMVNGVSFLKKKVKANA